MSRDLVLVVHVFSGVVAVLLGPPTLFFALRRHRHTGWGLGYHLAVLGVCVTAVGLAGFDWSRLWFFVPISAMSYGFLLWGDRASTSTHRRWWRGVLRGYGGAWIALWTAILVVGVPGQPVVWFVPLVVGSALIEWRCLRPKSGWVAG
jgi:hypothetical protein